ncbi:elongation of fatty acids protein 3-like [Phragmites australis]|uniref:elongation of fatty acids protein 3-like n=1 Tax=Phragmites australis TaxID=29695 RepID=UPI002D773804|nr:elongation of fatty acids protein 3-like [Phragmites australis]
MEGLKLKKEGNQPPVMALGLYIYPSPSPPNPFPSSTPYNGNKPPPQLLFLMGATAYWLAEHPAIVGFRWSPTHLWFSTWAFLLGFLASYVALCLAFDAFLGAALRRRKALPLGPVPAAHALLMAAVSAAIFAGTLLSAVAEIRDTRWSWLGRSRTTPFRWLLCFPPGTRSSGRVFFWSYAYYLSRYLHAARGVFAVLRRRRGAAARVFAHAASIAMAFLWLEFSQSFQVLAILASTLAHAVAFGFRFWVGAGLPAARAARAAPVALACHLALLGCNLACHVGVVWMHFSVVGGGCSGIGAWVFNTLLNGALLWVFLHCYGKRGVCDDGGSARADSTDKKEL